MRTLNYSGVAAGTWVQAHKVQAAPSPPRRGQGGGGWQGSEPCCRAGIPPRHYLHSSAIKRGSLAARVRPRMALRVQRGQGWQVEGSESSPTSCTHPLQPTMSAGLGMAHTAGKQLCPARALRR